MIARISSIAVDPIEKKPLKMWRPGTHILSVGFFGCNLKCPWCQNHRISMPEGPQRCLEISSEELADLALRQTETEPGNIGVAYTYNEPLVQWKFIREAARKVKARGLCNVLVTNGCWDDHVMDEVFPFIDAMNIDLKTFDPEKYAQIGGDLEKVKHFIERAADSCHVEVTTLAVPGISDDPNDMEREAAWLASINNSIPLHISRFFPAHQMMDAAPTSIKRLRELETIATARLEHVFLGNV